MPLTHTLPAPNRPNRLDKIGCSIWGISQASRLIRWLSTSALYFAFRPCTFFTRPMIFNNYNNFNHFDNFSKFHKNNLSQLAAILTLKLVIISPCFWLTRCKKSIIWALSKIKFCFTFMLDICIYFLLYKDRVQCFSNFTKTRSNTRAV